MLYETGTREVSQIKTTGYKPRTIMSAILFRYSSLYRNEFDLPKIKSNGGRYYITERQLYKIISFLKKYKNTRLFQFYLSIEKSTNKYDEIKRKWEKKMWS